MTAFHDYPNYDGVGLAKLIADGEISAEEVLEAAIQRTEAFNPSLNAVVHTMYDQARAALQRLPRGPLAGVPFLLKDLNLAYAGQPLSNGSRLYRDFIPDFDSTLTERYKSAGLLILGKTNTPEMGIAMITEPQAFGATRNPWNLDYSTAGSSGGAAAAVAARMVPLAHATDGGGSIRMPAANCGLFGLKPTRARTPAGPQVGEGWSGLATGHCVSLSVRDSAALLDVSHGPAPGDPYCAPPPLRAFLDEVGADPGALNIAVITAAPKDVAIHPECLAGVANSAKLCRELGHQLFEARFDYDFDALARAVRVIIAGNLRNALEQRWRDLGRGPGPQDLEGITWTWAQEGPRYSAVDYAAAVQAIHALGRRLAAFYADNDYDVVLSPVLAQPPLKLGSIDTAGDDLDAYLATMEIMPFTPLYNLTGHPAMSVPLHWSESGLPIGIHFGARFGDEAVLFRLAAQLERAQPWFDRRPALERKI